MLFFSVYFPRLSDPEYIKLIDKHIKDNEKTMENHIFCKWLSLKNSMIAMSRAIDELRSKVSLDWNEIESNIQATIKQKIEGNQDKGYQKYLLNLESLITHELQESRNSEVLFAVLNMLVNSLVALTSAAGIVILGFFATTVAPLATTLLLISASFLAAALFLLTLNSAVIEGQFIANTQIKRFNAGIDALQSFAPSTTKNVVTDEPPAYTSFTPAFPSILQ
ncbi:MAG: hypothetical protein BGO90_13565 [Legionella sp. 40-6]|nr:MAG: hypothetical protein BGO90_13565 [Legionella sp. 40-6]